jgi:transmembrane sensor
MSIYRFKYLFQRFINKTATREESDEFLSMMNKESYDKETQELLQEFWKNNASVTSLEDEKAERIFNHITSSERAAIPVQLWNRLWIRWAAAVIILISFGLLFYKQTNPSAQLVSAARVQGKAAVVTPTRRFINLPDGSAVILNADSKLEFSTFNRNGKREITLIGEAFFDIVHDKTRPFIVHTGKLRTTVLGTAFNVKASPGNTTVVVTVKKGKVKVGDSKRTYNVIDPDQQIIFNSKKETYLKKVVKSEEVTAWLSGDMYFDDVSMKDVAKQLQERFGVTIVFSNELVKNCRFSATFLKTQSLEQILNIIGEFNNIKYQFRDKETVILDGVGCS